jgi:hypothetical protein
MNIRVTHVKNNPKKRGPTFNKYVYSAFFMYKGTEVRTAFDYKNNSVSNISFGYKGASYGCETLNDFEEKIVKPKVAPSYFYKLFETILPAIIQKHPEEVHSQEGYQGPALQ